MPSESKTRHFGDVNPYDGFEHGLDPRTAAEEIAAADELNYTVSDPISALRFAQRVRKIRQANSQGEEA